VYCTPTPNVSLYSEALSTVNFTVENADICCRLCCRQCTVL